MSYNYIYQDYMYIFLEETKKRQQTFQKSNTLQLGVDIRFFSLFDYQIEITEFFFCIFSKIEN